MIEHLRIRGLGVIDDVAVDLGGRLTVLTGETGAGKTMVLTAIGLLMGARADPALVRVGCARAEVEGVVDVRHLPGVAEQVLAAGGALDDGRVVLARIVESAGRSRAYLGGRAVPAALLAGLSDDVIAVHGQSDQVRLLQPTRQRALLDRAGGSAVAAAVAAHEQAYDAWQDAQRRLSDVAADNTRRLHEVAYLRASLEDISAVSPLPGEDEQLAQEQQRLGHLDQLRVATAAALAALDADDGQSPAALALLGQAQREVRLVASLDPTQAELAQRIVAVTTEVSDVAADLARYGSDLEVDPARLAEVSQRRATLAALQRRYADQVDDLTALLAWADDAARRLALLDLDDDARARLEAQVVELAAAARRTAATLTAARSDAAARLGAVVTTEVRGLAMPGASVQVAVQPRDRVGRSGADEVAVLLQASPDGPLRPLGAGASGGELSRLMLALEVALTDADPVPTLVFDEVDAGIGGQTAIEVGRRLAALASRHQVLVVTHLPQVAAFADQHLVVQKDGTTTRVAQVGDADRVAEVARMMTGLTHSRTAREHADELLSLGGRHTT